MFYYYEKDQKILASERNDLPYAQGKPIPGAPIYYLVEATRCWAEAPSR